ILHADDTENVETQPADALAVTGPGDAFDDVHHEPGQGADVLLGCVPRSGGVRGRTERVIAGADKVGAGIAGCCHGSILVEPLRGPVRQYRAAVRCGSTVWQYGYAVIVPVT